MTYEEKKNEDLRKRAERLAEPRSNRFENMDPKELRNVLQELQIHEIELELQNEELRRTQEELERTRQKYTNLFHYAPIGYVVLESGGLIKEVSSAFAGMLNKDKTDLLDKAFADYLVSEDQSIFRARYSSLIKNPDGKSLVVRFKAGRRDPLITRLETLSSNQLDEETDHPKNRKLLITVSDITEQITEEELRKESEQRYRRLSEDMPVYISVFKPDGTLTYVNSHLAEFTGMNAEDLAGKNLFSFLPEEMTKQLHDGLKGVSPEQPMMTHEQQLVDQEGEVRWQSWINRAFFDENQTITYIQGVGQDITDKKRAEEERERALNVEQARSNELELLLEAAKHVLENNAFEITARKIFDIARNLTGAQSGYVALLSEDGAENEVLFLEAGGMPCTVDESLPMPIRGLRAEAYRSGECVCDNDFMNSEWVNFMPSGHVDLRNVMFAPLTIKGVVVGIMGLANKDGDFSEENKRIAAALGQLAAMALNNSRNLALIRQTEERYREIFEGSRDGFVMVDKKGAFIDANQAFCKMLGYTLEELRALKDFYEITPERWREWENDEIWKKRLLQKGYSETYEKEYQRKNGEIFPVELQSYAVTGDDGSPVYLWGVARDISDRKRHEAERTRLQDQLLQSQKMESIGRLAGGVAHDFNNLLTGITGNVALTLMDLPNDDPLRDTLEQINQAADSAAHLTQQLLAFSRKQLISPKVLDLNRVIDHSFKMLRRIIGEDINLKFRPEKMLGQVKVDQGQLEQILINLAVNARDAMIDGGNLTLETDSVILDETYCSTRANVTPGEYVMLAVSDDGIGMAEDVRSRLFEPFFTTKPKDKGTGLGLATVYGAVKQNNGHIEVYSEPGEGTTFKVYFPRIEAKAESINRIVTFDDLPRGTETVLVVEDERLVRNIAAKVLDRQGYKVHCAESGIDALTLFKKENLTVDLLMTDIIMPKMNGKELADKLKAEHPSLTVLFTSGYTENVIAHHGVLDEGLNFIGKPYTPQALAKKVREVLDR